MELLTPISISVKIRKESGIYLGSTLLSHQLNKRRELDYKLSTLLFGRNNLSVAQLRSYCTQNSKLTHVGDDGKLKMVDVGSKTVTKRTAIASGVVQLNTEIIQLIKENSIKKGDVITVAKVAGIMAAKRTDQMIPLCHNIALSSVNIDIDVEGECGLRIRAVTIAGDKTGVEMEALTAVSVAALTVYDMCKALSHDIVIKDIRLEQKTGGKSDYVRK